MTIVQHTINKCFSHRWSAPHIIRLDPEARKNSEIRINAPLSRQPLVKGERSGRCEVSAAMLGKTCPHSKSKRSLHRCAAAGKYQERSRKIDQHGAWHAYKRSSRSPKPHMHAARDRFSQCVSALTHHLDFESLSRLLVTKIGNHCRSDPVRVQSTIASENLHANCPPFWQ